MIRGYRIVSTRQPVLVVTERGRFFVEGSRRPHTLTGGTRRPTLDTMNSYEIEIERGLLFGWAVFLLVNGYPTLVEWRPTLRSAKSAGPDLVSCYEAKERRGARRKAAYAAGVRYRLPVDNRPR